MNDKNSRYDKNSGTRQNENILDFFDSDEDENYYSALGLDENCTTSDIRLAHSKMIKKYHPDKCRSNKYTDEQKKENEEIFEYIQEAYEHLIKKHGQTKTKKKNNKNVHEKHLRLKKEHGKFLKEQEKKEISKEDAKNEFKKMFQDVDEKIDYKRDKEKKAISDDSIKKKIKYLKYQREEDDIEATCPKLFDDNSFDNDRFQALYDNTYKQKHEDTAIDVIPKAFSMSGEISQSIFASVDDYSDPTYISDSLDNKCQLIDFKNSINEKDLKKKDANCVKPASYTKGHNKIDNDYDILLQKRLNERETFTKELEDERTKHLREVNNNPYSLTQGMRMNPLNPNVPSHNQNEFLNCKTIEQPQNRLFKLRFNDENKIDFSKAQISNDPYSITKDIEGILRKNEINNNRKHGKRNNSKSSNKINVINVIDDIDDSNDSNDSEYIDVINNSDDSYGFDSIVDIDDVDDVDDINSDNSFEELDFIASMSSDDE